MFSFLLSDAGESMKHVSVLSPLVSPILAEITRDFFGAFFAPRIVEYLVSTKRAFASVDWSSVSLNEQ